MAQVWPRTDTFDRNPTQIGVEVTNWRAFRPSGSGWAAGLLHDFDGDGQPSAHEPSSVLHNPCAFAWRNILPQDVSVEAWTTLPGAAALGAFGAYAYKQTSVFVRLAGGATSGSGTTAHFRDMTGFELRAYIEAAGAGAPRISFALYRWSAGSSTLLAGNLGVSLPVYTVDVTKPLGLRLDVYTFVPGATLVWGWLSNINFNGTTVADYNLFASSVPYVAVDTSSVPALDAAGRGGFAITQDQTHPSFFIPIAGKIQSFTVRPITSINGTTFLPNYGAVYLRDEFKRQSLPNTLSATNDFGATGRSVQSGWFGDLHAANSPGVLVYPNTTLSSLAQTAGTTTTGSTLRFLLSQRPPDDPRRQTARLKFNLSFSGSGGTTPELGMGAWVHAQGTTAASANSTAYGYAAVAICKPSLSPGIQWRFELWRIRAGATEILASGTGTWTSGSGGGVTAYVELEVAPVPGSPTLDGPVRLRVRGGLSVADQTLTLTGGIPGIAADGDYIIDSSSDRITSGGEGIMFVSQNSTHVGQIQEWSQGTLIEVEEGINDMPNVSLDAEPEATESLNDYAKLVLPITVRDEWETLSPRAESGHAWVRVTDRTPRRVWSGCETFPMTRADADDFLAFWRAHATPGRAFTYTDEIKGATYTVRAVDASLEEDRLFKDSIVFRFDMEELRA